MACSSISSCVSTRAASTRTPSAPSPLPGSPPPPRKTSTSCARCPARARWWRLASTADGNLVGFTLPAATTRNPVIGYVAVLPERRGRGYAYDLLAEATHLLVAEGAGRIIANTDVTNIPMAAAFAKAGYPVTEHRVNLVR